MEFNRSDKIENKIDLVKHATRNEDLWKRISSEGLDILSATRTSWNFEKGEKKVKFTTYSNAELLAWWKSKKLIPEGGSTKDLINVMKKLDSTYAKYLSQLIKYNNGMKRWKSARPFLVGKVGLVYIDNPREYIEAIKNVLNPLLRK